MKLLFATALLAALLAPSAHAAEPSLSPLELHADLYATDLQPLNLEISGGTHLLRAVLFAGAGRARQFVAGTGVGVHLGHRLWLDMGATCGIVQALTGTQPTDLLWQLRASLGVELHPGISFFLGPAADVELSFAPNPILRGSALAPVVLLAPPEGGGGWQFWGGLQAGIRL